MPEVKLMKAVSNSIALYNVVFLAHDITLQTNPDISFTTAKTPPLFSNLVTTSRCWQPNSILKTIDTKAEIEHWSAWSIKDSFQCLDLSSYGFKKLFDSKWFYVDITQFTPVHIDDIRFEIVKTSEDLPEWIRVWGEGIELGTSIYKPSLVADASLYFVIGYQNNEATCVALLNKSQDIIGISNFFVPEYTREKWSALISFIQREIGAFDIVGYIANETVQKIHPLGIEAVGDLSVWLKTLN